MKKLIGFSIFYIAYIFIIPSLLPSHITENIDFLLVIIFLPILFVLIYIAFSGMTYKNKYVKISKPEIKPETQTEESSTKGELRIVMLIFERIDENVEENIQKLSEISGYSKDELTTIVEKYEKLTDEEADALSDEEFDKFHPVIKRGLTLQEAKDLKEDLKKLGIICSLDTEDE